MKKFITLRFIWILALSGLIFPELGAQKVVHGEWGFHEAIWIPFFPEADGNAEDSLTILLIKKLAEYVPTVIVVDDDAAVKRGMEILARNDVDTSFVSWEIYSGKQDNCIVLLKHTAKPLNATASILALYGGLPRFRWL